MSYKPLSGKCSDHQRISDFPQAADELADAAMSGPRTMVRSASKQRLEAVILCGKQSVETQTAGNPTTYAKFRSAFGTTYLSHFPCLAWSVEKQYQQTDPLGCLAGDCDSER